MNYPTIDRLLGEPRKKLIVKYYDSEFVCDNTDLKREGEHIVFETRDIIKLFPINQTSITYLKHT